MNDENNPVSTSLLAEQAWFALGRNDWRTALNLISAIDAVPQSTDFSKLFCCVYLQASRWPELAGFASSAAQRFPEQPLFWELWAWAEYMSGDSPTAIRILERVVEKFRTRESFAFMLAYLQAGTEQFTEAQHWLDLASHLSFDPTSFQMKASSQRELQALFRKDELSLSI